MAEEESRYITNPDVEQAYSVTVEQVVVELIQIAGVADGTPQEVMQNLKGSGWNIARHIAEPWKHEIITLTKDNELSHVGQVFLEGDEVLHIISTKEEFERAGGASGIKTS